MESRRLLLATIAVAVCGFTFPSHAELYRCERSDGSVVYTDNRMACPGALPHESTALIQKVAPLPTKASQSIEKRLQKMRNDALAEEKQAKLWKKKKTDAQQELAKLNGEHAELKPFISHCARGGTVYMVKDNGLEENVSCPDVRKDLAEVEKRQAELTTYLDSGLKQECHLAACLPGWVR